MDERVTERTHFAHFLVDPTVKMKLCIGIVNGSCYVQRLLQCSHEEAHNRIMFYLNYAVKISKFCSTVIASPDTDIFVCALHHFSQLVYFGLNEFCLSVVEATH